MFLMSPARCMAYLENYGTIFSNPPIGLWAAMDHAGQIIQNANSLIVPPANHGNTGLSPEQRWKIMHQSLKNFGWQDIITDKKSAGELAYRLRGPLSHKIESLTAAVKKDRASIPPFRLDGSAVLHEGLHGFALGTAVKNNIVEPRLVKDFVTAAVPHVEKNHSEMFELFLATCGGTNWMNIIGYPLAGVAAVFDIGSIIGIAPEVPDTALKIAIVSAILFGLGVPAAAVASKKYTKKRLEELAPLKKMIEGFFLTDDIFSLAHAHKIILVGFRPIIRPRYY